jgi:murein L,D-transpeptidase YcbB/YkuD
MPQINRPIFDTAHDPRSGFGLRMFAVLLSVAFLLVAAGSAVSSETPAPDVEPPAAAAPQTPDAASPPAGDVAPAAEDGEAPQEETPRPFLAEQVRGLDAAVRDDAERFYRDRGSHLAWLDAAGTAERRAEELIAALEAADARGLDPADYGAAELRRRLADEPHGDEALDALDAALTAAFLRYAGDLLDGRLSPQQVQGTWHLEPRRRDLAAVLAEAIGEGTDVGSVLRDVEPQHEGYQKLLPVLDRYRRLAAEGGWPAVPDGPVVAAGDAMEPARYRAFVERLAAEGYLPPEVARASLDRLDAPAEEGEAAGAVLDERLAKALRHFQERHGIREDGKLGPNSQRELNVSAARRADLIALNLERWRWLPAELGARHVEVNLPGFTLRAVENGRVVEQMDVVVGKEGWATPVMSETMERVVVNPYWNVPESILRADVAPQVRQDRGYLAAQDMEVLDLGSGRVLPAHAVDWSDPEGVRVRQRPGPANALGRIKFLFPNELNVYLHDTPAESAFERTNRDLSHGCVRLERPLDLAGFVFAEDAAWSAAEIESAIASGERRVIELDETLPVHFLYWTAFVDEDGEAHFRPDLYDYDDDHLRALEGRTS